MLTHIIVLALTIGSYKKELLDDVLTKKLDSIEPIVYEYWEKTGYNGVYPNGPNDELWSQIVNGKNYILKKSFVTGPMSHCIKFHESFNGDVTILDTKTCNSVFDILS
tara:strand:+ start:3532 stop:3855 length:324 start_codon:yes stop_codon:yes gene_type:complete